MQAVRSRVRVKLAPETKSALKMAFIGMLLSVCGFWSMQAAQSGFFVVLVATVANVISLFCFANSLRELVGRSILVFGLFLLLTSRCVWTVTDQRVYCIDGKASTTFNVVMPWSTVKYLSVYRKGEPITLSEDGGCTLTATCYFIPNQKEAQEYFDRGIVGDLEFKPLVTQMLDQWRQENAQTLKSLQDYKGEVRFPVRLVRKGVVIEPEIVYRSE